MILSPMIDHEMLSSMLSLMKAVLSSASAILNCSRNSRLGELPQSPVVVMLTMMPPLVPPSNSPIKMEGGLISAFTSVEGMKVGSI